MPDVHPPFCFRIYTQNTAGHLDNTGKIAIFAFQKQMKQSNL